MLTYGGNGSTIANIYNVDILVDDEDDDGA